MNQEAKIKRLEERIKNFETKIDEKGQEIRLLKSLLTQEREWRKLFQSLIKEAAQADDLKTDSWERW
jgi:archaellum component FlaC